MGNSNDLVENLMTITSYNFISVMFIFIILFIYGIGKDYLLHGIYTIAEGFESSGMIGDWIVPFIATMSNTADILPQFLDLLWILLTITLFIELIISSYYASREGWFSTLGFLTAGILFMLYLTSIFVSVVEWVQINLIDGLFSSISYSIPFLTFYLNNVFIINTILIVLCVIANYIDLDMSGFNNRKEREKLEEVV